MYLLQWRENLNHFVTKIIGCGRHLASQWYELVTPTWLLQILRLTMTLNQKIARRLHVLGGSRRETKNTIETKQVIMEARRPGRGTETSCVRATSRKFNQAPETTFHICGNWRSHGSQEEAELAQEARRRRKNRFLQQGHEQIIRQAIWRGCPDDFFMFFLGQLLRRSWLKGEWLLQEDPVRIMSFSTIAHTKIFHSQVLHATRTAKEKLCTVNLEARGASNTS